MDDLSRDIAVLLTLASVFGYINYRYLKLPPAIGLTIVAMTSSLVALAVDFVMPGWGVGPSLHEALISLDFSTTLMNGLLSFLLFAGALHVNLNELAARRYAIGTLATVGVISSTFLVASAMWLLFKLMGMPLSYIYCLLFGALISPTDPVAVLGILKSANAPKSLEAKIAGESLFNDGVGIVVFIILLGIATGTGGDAGSTQGGDVGAAEIALLFAREALGGILLGLVTGVIAFLLLRRIDEHNLEVLITLALVAGTYEIALTLHTSGPIAVVVAGLLIGNHGRRLAMSAHTRAHLTNFWTLIDEILNAVLFLLIGMEVILLSGEWPAFIAGLIGIPIVLASRFISVGIPVRLLALKREFTPGAIRILTWGGLRGGISVALALSLPEGEEKGIILTVCYVIVIFSIVVQGLTVGPLIKRLVPAADLQSVEPVNDQDQGDGNE